jgi:hypothetical protein
MRIIAIILSLSMLVLSACAGSTRVPLSKFTRVEENVGGLTKHFSESVFKKTDRGYYSVEACLFDGTLKTGRNDFDVIVHNSRDEDVGGASLTVVARMREGGVSSEPEKIREGVPGLYSVDNLTLERSGHWDLLITVSKGGQVDSVVFSFRDVF